MQPSRDGDRASGMAAAFERYERVTNEIRAIPMSVAFLRAIAGMCCVMAVAASFAGCRPQSSPGSKAQGLSEDRTPLADADRAEAQGRPRAAIDSLEFDFGMMDVGQSATHAFVIRNEGDGTLELRAGRSTCQCTKFEVEKESVAPGESARVYLHWKTDEADKPFHHGAVVKTNDPDQREIMLRIKGKVKTFLASSPGGVVFSTVRPGERPHYRVVVYSQVWKRFEIEKVETGFKFVSWKIGPAAPEELQKLSASSGYGLELTLDSALPHGQFKDKLFLHARILDDEAPEAPPKPVEVHVLGNRVGNASWIGPIVDGEGFLDIGLVEQGKGTRHTINLFLRGGSEIGIEKIEAEPEFLQVKAEPAASGNPLQTRYRLEIAVPPGAPMANCMTEMGQIRLLTDSTTDPEVRVQVKMAVVAEE